MTSHSEPKAKNPLVKITVDGKEVLAPKGENLLKVLLENKAAVPYYCYHPGLSIAGACRMCFVEVEGQPRPLISCNATVTEGMAVKTTTEKVKEIQKWNLAFHLINHPLDCPICDQAGECGLQNYYMKYGKYNSDMHENKVLKRKVISIGDHVMLDTERCILCSRCVRFFDEVPKTGEMAIFNRGDRSEIGTYQDKELNNNYTLNSVDICPVGALTSKDFRFKKRVWFLKDGDSICPGCSTGCNVTVSFDPVEKRTYRMRPRLNEEVNGYWMCDYGRMRYKQTQPENRILSPLKNVKGDLVPMDWKEAHREWKDILSTSKNWAILVTPQYTSEELESVYHFFTQTLKTHAIFHTVESQKLSDTIVDELLLRQDKNPNSKGLLAIAKKYNLDTQDLFYFGEQLKTKKWETLIVFGPEDPQSMPHFLNILEKGKEISKKILIGTQISHASSFFDLILPTLTFVEKNGTFINFKGISQKLNLVTHCVEAAKPLAEILCV